MNRSAPSENRLPLVTVVIPVLNNAEGITETVDALLKQVYPDDRVEIIVVDNGSTDGTQEAVRSLPVTFLQEQARFSPYPSRNRAVKAAKGEIIAFTDSDCIPGPDWIRNAVSLLSDPETDLVGGLVRFRFSPQNTAAEYVDSLMNLEVRENVQKRGVAKTGNLVVRKRLFDEIGMFREDVRSGGDVEWTRRATSHGHRMVFGEEVVVYKQARKLISLLRKQYRVGKGQPSLWKKEGMPVHKMLIRIVVEMRPATGRFVRSMTEYRHYPAPDRPLLPVLGVIFLTRLATAAGRLRGLFES